MLRGRIGPLTLIVPPVAPEATSAIDAVALSHLHADHADVASLRRLGAATPIVAPRGSEAWLRGHGASDVRELGRGDSVAVGALRLVATDAVHDGRRPFGPTAEPIGFVIAGSRSVYFAGDTDLF